MSSPKYPKSDALNREVQCYPAPKYFNLVKGYAALNRESISRTGSLAIKCFFDSMPADEQQRYVDAAKQITSKKDING